MEFSLTSATTTKITSQKFYLVFINDGFSCHSYALTTTAHVHERQSMDTQIKLINFLK